MIRILFLLVIVAYFYVCYKNVSINYWKYLRKTYLWIVAFFFAFCTISYTSSHNIVATIMGFIVSFIISYGINSLFYIIAKQLRKTDIAKESESLNREIESQRQQQEAKILENDDMKKMKLLIDEISQRINYLSSFNKEVNNKIHELENIGNNAIAEVYGNFLIDKPQQEFYTCYNEIHNKYSSSVDSIISMQCDKIVQKISNAIDNKKKILDNNFQDKLKYESLQNALNKQYDIELKIQKMKAINNKVNELADSDSDITTTLNSSYILDKTRHEFDQLNLEIETRRELEVKYSTIDI